MVDRSARFALAACLSLGLVLPAAAETLAFVAARIEVAGPGIRPTVLDRDSLSAFPTRERDVSFATSKGEHRGRYKGVLLWTVLERAGLLQGGDGHHPELRRTFVVTGRDGYAIAFSVGEIAPDFGDRGVMIALTEDDKPLPAEDGLRLIVPGDKRGARSVMDVVRIEVR